MKFRTEYMPERGEIILDPQKPVVLAGSCFSQHILEKMRDCGWEAENPFGTHFNPESIATAISLMSDIQRGKEKFEATLFQYNGIWNSDYFDSSFSSARREDCVEEFLNRQKIFLSTLNRGKILIVTFGTSICHCRKDTTLAVGNCHKQPSGTFFEKRLTVEEVASLWKTIIGKLKETYPGIIIIFTVSPVRHLKNGFTGNVRSKAVLQLGIEQICREKTNCLYFPAYEIFNDDLRDYRFYASDLVHPSPEGVEYVWEKFKASFLDESGLKILEAGEKEQKAARHRPKTGALGKPLVNPSTPDKIS